MKSIKILLILIFVIIFSWFYYIYINSILFSKNEVTVPNLVGYELDEATKKLQESNLAYVINYIDGESNLVSYTRPKENTKVKEGYVVSVYVYNNEILNYKNFEGLVFDTNEENIIKYCNIYSLNYEVIYEINNDIPEGIIIKQIPNDSENLTQNDTIKFYVSANDSFIQMPNLVGMNINDATSILNEYDLKFNLIYICSLIDCDLVISQEVKEGKVIKKGNSYPIDIYISKGITTDLCNVNIEEFLESLTYLDVKYDIIYIDSIDNNKLLKIISYENDSLAYRIYISK